MTDAAKQKMKRTRALLELQACLRQRFDTKEARSAAMGDLGERVAIAAFRASATHFEIVSQEPDTKGTALKARGGKRPDFICAESAAPDAPAYCVDAKFTKTDGGKRFLIARAELAEYRALQDFVESDVLLLVMPQEWEGRFGFWVRLEEFCDCADRVDGKVAAAAALEGLPADRKISIEHEHMPSADEFLSMRRKADELYRLPLHAAAPSPSEPRPAYKP